MIKSGLISQRYASQHYNIPRRTINYKLKKKHMQKVGKPTVFSYNWRSSRVVVRTSNDSKQKKFKGNKGIKSQRFTRNESSSSESDEVSIPYMDSSESDWFEEDNAESDMGNKSKWKDVKRIVGEFVVFHYEDELFPGKTVEICSTGVKMKAMQRSLKA